MRTRGSARLQAPEWGGQLRRRPLRGLRPRRALRGGRRGRWLAGRWRRSPRMRGGPGPGRGLRYASGSALARTGGSSAVGAGWRRGLPGCVGGHQGWGRGMRPGSAAGEEAGDALRVSGRRRSRRVRGGGASGWLSASAAKQASALWVRGGGRRDGCRRTCPGWCSGGRAPVVGVGWAWVFVGVAVGVGMAVAVDARGGSAVAVDVAVRVGAGWAVAAVVRVGTDSRAVGAESALPVALAVWTAAVPSGAGAKAAGAALNGAATRC